MPRIEPWVRSADHLALASLLIVSANPCFRFFVAVRDQLNEPRHSGGDDVKIEIFDPDHRQVRYAIQDLQVKDFATGLLMSIPKLALVAYQ